MTELTHNDAEDGFHEIQLSGKQVVFAFMLTTAAAVFIFLLGVQVGRNAKTPARAEEPAETAAAASPTVNPQPPVQASPAPQVTTAPPADIPGQSSAQNDKLTYQDRLAGDKPLPEKLKPNADDAPQPAPAVAANHAAAPKAAKNAQDAPPPETHAPAAKAAAPSGARPGVWVVQLVALKDRGAASAVVQRLSSKGYPAFVVSPSAGAPSIYRVQVGRYNDRREAEQVAHRLEKEEQFKPWISH